MRSVCIVTSGFIEQAQAIARALGNESVSIVEYPGVVMTQSDEEIVAVVSEIAPLVIEELTGSDSEVQGDG